MHKTKLHIILYLAIITLSIFIIAISTVMVKKAKTKKLQNKDNAIKLVTEVTSSLPQNCNFTLTHQPNYITLHSTTCKVVIIVNTTTLQQKTLYY